ncbi:MAG TPA: TPM domain-containing protein, partial [Burkholderiaceae bacterium]
MDLRRFARHVAVTPWTSRRAFPDKVLDTIQHEVAGQEKRHRGEIRFVVEAELTTGQLWRGLTARSRAIEVFSMLQVWNTESNSGVLIYVLLADHQVEVVTDRGIQRKVAASDWAA